MIPAIVIIGPTCTGKTSLGISLALSFGGEIINGDSMQIYRGMDIGTAKPSAEELSAVPHHLIDLLDISDPFSVADFCGAALSAVGALCGGEAGARARRMIRYLKEE